MAQILVDTSAIFALIDRGDSFHLTAKKVLNELHRRRVSPLITNFILAEAHALLLNRLGADIARSWLFRNIWPVERVTDDDEARAQAVIRQYADKTFSYTDATSFAVMERLGLKAAFAFDPHFRQYGFQVLGLKSR